MNLMGLLALILFAWIIQYIWLSILNSVSGLGHPILKGGDLFVLDSWFLILDSRFLILDPWSLILDSSWFLTTDSWFLILDLSLILDSWYLNLDSWFSILDSRLLILDYWFLTMILTPDSWLWFWLLILNS